MGYTSSFFFALTGLSIVICASCIVRMILVSISVSFIFIVNGAQKVNALQSKIVVLSVV